MTLSKMRIGFIFNSETLFKKPFWDIHLMVICSLAVSPLFKERKGLVKNMTCTRWIVGGGVIK